MARILSLNGVASYSSSSMYIVLNVQKVNIMERHSSHFQTISGYVFSGLRCFLTIIGTLLSGGLFLILLTWRADIKLWAMYENVPLQDAAVVLLKVRKKYALE